jgi:hypothetical protein
VTLFAYLRGCAALVSGVVALAFAGHRLRIRLAPDWDGLLALLADGVLGFGLLVVTLEVLGSVGLLRPVWTMVVVPVAGLAVGVGVGTGIDPTRAPRRRRARPSIDRLTAFALLVAFVVFAQWVAHAARVAEGGLRDMDSLRYHGPFAARWVQQHGLLRVHHTSSELQETFFPGNAELVNAYGILLFGRDVLTPFLNLGWYLVGCVAAVSLHPRAPARAAALAGFAAVCSTPLLASIEPGSAKNDLAAAVLVLSFVALLRPSVDHAGRAVMPSLAIAGVAAGLAVGTKLTTLVPVIVLVVGTSILVGRRGRSLATLFGAAAVTGGFWYLRNLAVTGNPLPWITHLGPIRLPGPAMTGVGRAGFTIVHYGLDRSFWTDVVPRGLDQSFGPLWPLLAVAVGAAAVMTALDGGSRTERLAGVACGLSALAYAVTPFSAGGPDGHPTLFALDLRFLAPTLVLAVVATSAVRRANLVVAAAGAIAVADQVAGHGRWPGPPLPLLRLTCCVAALAIVALVMMVKRPRLAVAIAIATGSAVAAGWPVQADELSDRYSQVRSGLTAAFAAFGPTHDLRIAVGGFADDYPLYGNDLSNHVQYVGVTLPHGGFRPAGNCREWRTALRQGHYDYVVVSRSPVARQHVPVEARWTAGDPAARLVLSRGVTRVYRLVGAPTPSACPPATRVASSP